MQERVFMGIGNKPFMDIQPSDAAISDRAVNYILMGRGKQILYCQQHKFSYLSVSRCCDSVLLLFDIFPSL